MTGKTYSRRTFLETAYRGSLAATAFGAGASVLGIRLAFAQEEEAAPAYGGTLVTATNADPATLNGAYRYELKGRIAYINVFNRLVAMSEVTSEIIPDLATSWEVSDDGETYTFNLAEGVRWHDGEPFSAVDVKFTFDAMFEREGPGLSAFKDYLDRVEVVDDLTVRMALKTPNAAFLSLLADPYGATTIILPRHLYEGRNWDDVEANDAPIGTGPFRFVEWLHGERIVLERNPDYFKEGLPYLDRIVVRIIPNAPTAVAALTAEELHYTGEAGLSGQDFLRFQGREGYRTAMTQGTLWHVGFNTRRAPFDNPTVRRAFAHAIDREDVALKAESGTVVVASGAYTEMVPWAFNEEARLPDYSPETAEWLLDEAGFPRDGDGVRMTLEWVASAGIGERIAEVVKEHLRQIGVEVDIQVVEFGTYTQMVIEGHDFDIAAMGGRQNPEPIDWHIFIQTDGYRNIYGYSNPEVDAWLEEAAVATDLGARAQAYHRVQEALIRDLPRVNLFTHTVKHVVVDRFRGFFFEEPAGLHTGYQVLERVWQA